MRLIRLFFVGLIFVGLIAGLLFNNLWRFMPEFNTLDRIFSTPVYLQALFLILAIATGWLFYKKASAAFLALFLVFSVLIVFSWYKAVISNGANAITTELYPFYRTEIKFDALKRIKRDGHTLTLLTTSKRSTLHTGFYPFGLDTAAIWDALQEQGNCLNKIDNQCTEIRFVSP